jgi:hypothetical protein
MGGFCPTCGTEGPIGEFCKHCPSPRTAAQLRILIAARRKLIRFCEREKKLHERELRKMERELGKLPKGE